MSICRFNYRSQALGRDVDITVTYPTTNFSYYNMKEGFRHHDAFGGVVKPQLRPGMKFQTVYLIHGGGDDDTTVYRYTNAERYANRNNVMLVTPNIVNSFGVDTNYGVQYATFLAEELPVVVQTLFASSPKREDNFIVGFAMGGNVALGMALMYPGLYRTCIDMSGGIGLTVNTETLRAELRSDHFRNEFPLYNSTFGQPEALEGSLMLASHALALVGVPVRRVLRVVQEQREHRYNLLRGYLPDADDAPTPDEAGERMASVTLAPGSALAGKPLAEVLAGVSQVRAVSLRRRSGQSVAATEDTAVLAGDTLLLSGHEEALAAARLVLEG